MKQLLTYIFFLLATATLAQTTSKNFVTSRTYKQTGASANDVGKVNIQVQYLDGIGRPSQTVSVGQSTSGTDLVQPIQYDPYGRQSKTYLPYAAGGLGSFQSAAVTNQAVFYTSNAAQLESSDLGKPYSETQLESSPLSRNLGQTAQGNKSLASSITYGSNAASEVKRYDFTTGTVTANGDYASGKLYKTRVTDENGKIIIEYKDITGLLICRRVVLGGSDTDVANLSTYYVYDDQNRLRAVLQPQYQDDANLTKFAFLYDYDTQGRLVSKSIPGGGTTKIVYDIYDRPVLSQDENQYAQEIWSFTKYDIMSRPVLTGIIPSTNSQSTWQTSLNSSTAHHEDKSGSGIGYSLNNTLPVISEADVLTVTYFDDYSFPRAGNLAYVNTYSISQLSSAKTRQTGGRTKMLTSGSNWLTSVIYYDSEYRTIQTIRELDDLGSGSVERVSMKYKYDLAPVVDQEMTEHILAGTLTNIHLKTFEYDHADRLLSIKEKLTLGGIGPGAVIKEATTLAQRYNILGQLQQKWFHSDDAVNFRRRTDYTNNIRGWITQGKTVYKQTVYSTDLPFYTFGLTYANGSNYTNGNISQMQWSVKDEISFTKGLSFSYDGANRLTTSAGLSGYADTESGITFDKNGNLKTLVRAGSVVDNLTYSYAGNQLSAISDGSGSNSGVKNGASSYAYDANGNMTSDGSRGATLAYNYLNLPQTVVLNSKTLTYNYDAAGTKHRYATDTLTIKYAGPFEYNASNNFSRLALSEGQALFRKDTLRFDYYLKDHLGNVRVVFDEKGKVLQETDYYAFGLAIDRSNPSQTPAARNAVNRYLYNEKELQVGSGFLDYGARMYMPEIGRWGVADPKAELLEMSSAYVYSLNSPLNYIDRHGELPIFINGRVSSNSERGNSSYWDAALLATIKNSGIANPGGETHFVDGDRYATYRYGTTFLQNGDYIQSGGNSPSQRRAAGYESAKRDFPSIMAKLARDPLSGKIMEKIQIYTHSRGAAFGTGYVEALLELIGKNANQFADPGHVIDFVFNMAPHQSDFLQANDGVNSYSMDHSRDKLSDNDMKGLKGAFSSNEKSSGFFGGHSTTSFIKDANIFLKAFQGAGGNTKKLIDDFVNEMQKNYGIKVTVSN